MVPYDHHESLLATLGVALGLATDERLRIEAGGFVVDPRTIEIESRVAVAAVDGLWGDVFVGLLACAAWEPEIYLQPWRMLASALLGAMGGSANEPGPQASPIPPIVQAKQWGSAHGSAYLLASGDLRIVVPLDLERNYKVTLPLQVGGRDE
jgi:hypothetical protein